MFVGGGQARAVRAEGGAHTPLVVRRGQELTAGQDIPEFDRAIPMRRYQSRVVRAEGDVVATGVGTDRKAGQFLATSRIPHFHDAIMVDCDEAWSIRAKVDKVWATIRDFEWKG